MVEGSKLRGLPNSIVVVRKEENVSSRRDNCVVSKQSNGKKDGSGCYSIVKVSDFNT